MLRILKCNQQIIQVGDLSNFWKIIENGKLLKIQHKLEILWLKDSLINESLLIILINITY